MIMMSTTASKCYGVESVSNFSGTIEVPEYLPKMLMEWSKCMLRTQPSDLIRWSAIYFCMKSNGEYPPIKPYLDPPGQILGPGGLTVNALKSLAMTMPKEFETYEKIQQIWDILSLDKDIFLEIIKIGKFEQRNNIRSIEFIGFATSYLNDRLRNTMIMLFDTLSKDDSNGIILHDFVTVYRFLARLDCTDILSSNRNDIMIHDKIANIEKNDSQLIKYTDSRSNSLKDECSYDNRNEESNVFDSLSMEGITIWQNDNNDELESLTDMLNKHEIIPPTVNTNICADILSPITTFKEYLNNDDLLSLLSVSSIISEVVSSEISVDTSPNDIKLAHEYTIAEEYNYNDEAITTYSTSSIINNDFDEKDNRSVPNDTDEIINYDVNNESNSIQDITSEGNAEISTVVKYEDTINDIDNETYEDDNNNNNNNVEINTDFIVMLALVDGEINNNEPAEIMTTEADEHVEKEDDKSTKSEFSLLERTELNDTKTVEHETHDDETVFNQTFNENVYMNTRIESTDASETSSGSDEFQYSEIDQHSVISITSRKTSVQMSSITDLALVTTDKNMDELLIYNESSMYDDFRLTDEATEETEHCPYQENEGELEFSKPSSVESIKHKFEETESFRTEEEHIRLLAGIGPAIPEKQIQLVVDWVTKCASNQNNYVLERNLLHFLCPPLDHILMTSDEVCI